jgi:hypothetical protein
LKQQQQQQPQSRNVCFTSTKSRFLSLVCEDKQLLLWLITDCVFLQEYRVRQIILFVTFLGWQRIEKKK